MRFTITLQAEQPNVVLPINYQYAQASWIYQLLEEGNERYADFLHGEGYHDTGHQRFKFYSFSELRTPGARVRGDRLLLSQPRIYFTIGFLTDVAAQSLILGLFRRSQPYYLGDDISGGTFQVAAVQMNMLPDLGATASFKTVSPTVISIQKEQAQGRSSKLFLSPTDPNYGQQLVGNLLRKYEIAQAAGLIAPTEEAPKVEYELLSRTVKEKHINLKEGLPGYTRVRGYKFQFQLQAPKPILELALLAGIGEKNAMGFGSVEVMSNPKN